MVAGLVKGEGFAVDASVMEADASRYHGKAPDEIDWSGPERQTRAVAEFLSGLDDEDPDADRKPPKVISPTDPCSAWTAKANKRVQFGYGLNYLIDIENAVIVDVEATPARTYDEVAATRTMIDRTEKVFGAKPERLAVDTGYGTGKTLRGRGPRRVASQPLLAGFEKVLFLDDPLTTAELHDAFLAAQALQRDSSAEKCRRVARRMSFTTFSADSFTGPDFCLIFAPSRATMNQKILPISIR